MGKYKLVLIEWEDSQLGFQGWKQVHDQPHEMPFFTSVGFLTHEDDRCKVLYPHIKQTDEDDDLSGSGDILIPVSAIKRMVELSVPTISLAS